MTSWVMFPRSVYRFVIYDVLSNVSLSNRFEFHDVLGYVSQSVYKFIYHDVLGNVSQSVYRFVFHDVLSNVSQVCV